MSSILVLEIYVFIMNNKANEEVHLKKIENENVLSTEKSQSYLDGITMPGVHLLLPHFYRRG